MRWPRRRAEHHRRGERAQTLSEFALVLPFLLILGLAAADYGRAYGDYTALTNAVRSGAAYASSSPEAAADTDGVRNAVLEELGDTWQADDLDVSVLTGTDSDGETFARVTVVHTFETLVQWPALPSSFDIQRAVQMRVIQ